MPVFKYRAIDQRQRPQAGTIAAESPRHARDAIRSRGLRVEEIARQKSGSTVLRTLLRQRATAAQLASLLRELSTLLAVGVGLVDALETLGRQHRGHLQTSILLVRDRIAGGARLAEAMEEQPHVFHELAIRMVEVGENAGNLEEVLDQVAGFMENSSQLRDRVVGALLYPAIVFLTASVVAIFLMTVVVPMLLTNLIEAGRDLPWPTRVLKGASDLLLEHGAVLALTALVVITVIAIALKTERGRRAWHGCLLRIPLVGTLAFKQAVSRLAATIATLMRSGIEYIDAADIGARTTGNLVIRQALVESNRRIATGKDIGDALEETGIFPPLVVHVFTVGQAAGRLEEMLDRLSTAYDRQVTSLSNRLASVLEPILILVLAIFVGFILFATLLPILEAGNVL